jgi:hypothetical protein
MLSQFLNERTRCLTAAAEAVALGHGGYSIASRATGGLLYGVSGHRRHAPCDPIGRGTIVVPGDLRQRSHPSDRRRMAVVTDATLKSDVERLIDPVTRVDPQSSLQWTCKRVRKLAEELRCMGYATNRRMAVELLLELGSSLQANRKTFEGKGHPDRDAQFEYLYAKVQATLKSGDPFISVDAKKKELVGDCKNPGREG